MGERFVELIADSKSPFVSKLSFAFLFIWLGILTFLKFFDIGMPESVKTTYSLCQSLKDYNISIENMDLNNAISCPMIVKLSYSNPLGNEEYS